MLTKRFLKSTRIPNATIFDASKVMKTIRYDGIAALDLNLFEEGAVPNYINFGEKKNHVSIRHFSMKYLIIFITLDGGSSAGAAVTPFFVLNIRCSK